MLCSVNHQPIGSTVQKVLSKFLLKYYEKKVKKRELTLLCPASIKSFQIRPKVRKNYRLVVIILIYELIEP